MMPAYELSTDERDRRWKIVRERMEAEEIAALIVHGSTATGGHGNGNLRWMTNLNHEGFLYFPYEGQATLFGITGGERPGWVPDYRGALPDVADALLGRLGEDVSSGTVGIVGYSGLTGQMYGFPAYTNDRLREKATGLRFVDETQLVEQARSLKGEEEVRALELAADLMQVGFDRVTEVAEPGVPEYEIRSAFMEALFTAGSEPYGLFLYRQGKDLFHAGQGSFRAEPPRSHTLASGEVILMEVESVIAGYKAQFNHAFTVGPVDDGWQTVFDLAEESFLAGLEVLRPGLDARDLDQAFLSPIRAADHINTNPCFHGIGLSLELPIGESPRLGYSGGSFGIEEGMVIEFEPHPVKPDYTRGASMGCPVLVTANGCRSLAPWYRARPTAL